jgi:cytochrome P450
MVARTFALSRRHPFNPPELLRELRNRPLSKVQLEDGEEVWLVARHDDVVAVLRDPRFSSDVGYHKQASPAMKKLTAWFYTSSLGHMDGAKHTRIREALAEGFLPKRIEAMRPALQAVVDGCVDEILELEPPIDLQKLFSMKVAGKVVVTALGMPAAYLQANLAYMDLLDALIESPTPEVEERYTAAIIDQYHLCEELLRNHEEPNDSLFAGMQRAVRNGRLSYHEAAGVITNVSTIGHQITASSLSMSVLMLLQNDDLAKAVQEKGDTLTVAVEELLRYNSPMNWGLPRAATEDVVMDGVLIHKGDRLLVSLPSANRDESVFGNSDEFDVSRREARHHVTFGAGPHVCIAQWLARAEVGISISTLAERIPTLRLAVPFEQLSFAEEAYIFTLDELPVTW